MSQQREPEPEENENNEGQSDKTDRSNEDESTCEFKMTESQLEMPVLEDEEMPTYVSVSTPSKPEDSDLGNNAKQYDGAPTDTEHSRSPYPSDDQGGRDMEVCVVSSGEDSDNPPYNDEDEDDYGDSEEMDEMDEMDLDHKGALLDDDEEEEDEDEEYLVTGCNDRLEHIPQDGKKHSALTQQPTYINFGQSYMMNSAMRRKVPPQCKFKHVESKVKQYIKDIKDLSRCSTEKRIKDQEQLSNINDAENKDTENEQLRTAQHNRRLKDYVRRGMEDEECEKLNTEHRERHDPLHMIENGKDNNIPKIAHEQHKFTRRDVHVSKHDKVTQNEKDVIPTEEKLEKQNGSVEMSPEKNTTYPTGLKKNLKLGDANAQRLINGHEQTPTVFDLRSLTYEEYMRGTPNSSQKQESNRNVEVMQQDNNETEIYNSEIIINMPDIDNNSISCPLKIQNVKSIGVVPEESKEYAENLNVSKNIHETDKQNETAEIASLQMQLQQKSVQFNGLKDAYQQLLAQSLKMKQEVDDLKKTITKYESEHQSPETKGISVQTDIVNDSVLNKGNSADPKEINNIISTSSLASTISSICPWTDSACSASISMKPPDLAAISNSDDSLVLTGNSPRKTTRPLSRAFTTSSRILQTLSNIAAGKSKPESPLVHSAKKRLNETPTERQTKENDATFKPSSSKKRKISDILEMSLLESFKVPHTTRESRKVVNSILDMDTELKYSRENLNVKSSMVSNPVATDANHVETPILTEDKQAKEDETDEQGEDIKCFMYKEDESSFLIQAEDTPAGKGRIRECGPYLIGNVEVRMSEANGTINIWGKELNQEANTDYEDEINVSTKSNKAGLCCEKTPVTKFNGRQTLCSHSSLCNVKKMPFSIDDDEKHHRNSLCSPAAFATACDESGSSKYHKDWGTCKHTSHPEEKTHSCCIHQIETVEKQDNCRYHQERQKSVDVLQNSSKERLNIKGYYRSSCHSTPESSKHLHDNIRHSTTKDSNPLYKCVCVCHRETLLNAEENCPVNSKCCHTVRDGHNSSSNEHNGIYFCTHSPSNQDEDDPLISIKQFTESPDVRQQRRTGKKVRGILMDFLKGCRGCRNTSSMPGNKDCIHEKDTSYRTNHGPQIKVSPCTTPDLSCSNAPHTNDRCCHAYARRIESQLEEFRMEIERVRSRSDAILDMLNMLRTVDMN